MDYRPTTHLCVFCPLAQLNGNATSNDHVRPISFEKSKVRDGAKCSVVGWGYGKDAVTLHEATVSITKKRDCLQYYLGLPDNLICDDSKSWVPEKVSL